MFGIGSNFKILIIMIWIILYIICAAICCGIILYVNDIEFKDSESILAITVSLVWPIYLVGCTLFGLGYCVKLLLTKVIKTK